MAKTRSQTGHVSIKKEEDCKDNVLLNDNNNTRNKITKRKPSRNKNRPLPAKRVKIEEDTDTKSILQSSPKLPKGHYVSQEQVNQLINAIVNDKMNITEASRMAKMSLSSGIVYYRAYTNDPEKRIPSARNLFTHPTIFSTQEQIENLIKYINEDKMNIAKASAKASMSYISGYRYYNKYLKDPNHNIPIPPSRQNYTQDQKNEFIGYIVNDKMTIKEASKKARMHVITAGQYYHKYFDGRNPDIATPSHITTFKHYTQEQIKGLISYIIDDKMSIAAASRKVKTNQKTAGIYYRQHLKDNNMEIPVPKYRKHYTQDRIDELFGYIVNDKMTIRTASRKANMNFGASYDYYHKYFKVQNPDIPTPSHITTSKHCTQEQKEELIGYVVNDKMSVNAASKKANMSECTGRKYYRQYAKEHNRNFHPQIYTQDKIDELIGYIVHDKMNIRMASKKTNIKYRNAYEYYRKYAEDHNLDMHIQNHITQDQKNEFIGYIIHDKMSIFAATKKPNISYTTGIKYYRKYRNGQKL